MKRLILARHGNTFDASRPTCWAGANQDFPLVDKGREQGRALGKALKDAEIQPQQVVVSPLIRTRSYALLAMKTAGISVGLTTDKRLAEIDYGPWGGKNDREIREMGDGEALKAWQEESIFPRDIWSPPPETLVENTRALAENIRKDLPENGTALVVTSNGVMRYFLHLVDNEFEKHRTAGTIKTKTGHVGLLEHNGSHWVLTAWNEKPAEAFSTL